MVIDQSAKVIKSEDGSPIAVEILYQLRFDSRDEMERFFRESYKPKNAKQ